jgi:outer membrane protein TolC
MYFAAENTDAKMQLSLNDCMLQAMKKNNDILIKAYSPEIAEQDVAIAESIFSPRISAELSYLDNSQSSTSAFQEAGIFNTSLTSASASLEGLMSPGTRYSFSLENQRVESDSGLISPNPYYAFNPSITLIQPLLKNAGRAVNEAPITIARNTKKQSDFDFEATVIDIISAAKKAYYQFAYALDFYETAGANLQRARELKDITQAQFDKGIVSNVALLEVETTVASREKLLITAESFLKSSEDQLRLVTNLVDDPQAWNAQIELTDKPAYTEKSVELQAALENAFRFRPDYQGALLSAQNADVQLKVLKNGTLPELDLVGSFGLNGLDDAYANSITDEIMDKKKVLVGVKFTKPLGGADAARFEQGQMRKAQVLLAIKKLEQGLVMDVRDKVRELDIQTRQVAASRLALEKETENYKAQKERYAAGQVSTHDILDYHDRLSLSELDYLKSLTDHMRAIVDLDRAQGLTLRENGIAIDRQEGAEAQ